MKGHSARSRWLTAGALVLSSLSLARTGTAQSQLEQVLQQYNSETVRGYIQPLGDMLTANLNSAYYHTAFIPKGKLRIGLELVTMTSPVTDEQRTYTASTPAGFTPSTFETATILGGTGSTVTGQNGSQYRGSDGFINGDYIPFGIPQLSIGGILGTELKVRYLTAGSLIDEEDVPKPSVFGISGQHSISQYISASPVDISIGALYNKVEIGDIVALTTMTFGAQVGKTFGVLSLYGGVSSGSGKMTLTYRSTDPSVTTPLVDVDIDTETQTRGTAGASLKLGPLQLFGDATFGSIKTFSGGLRIGS